MKKLIIIALSALLILSCKKKDEPTPGDPSNPSNPTNPSYDISNITGVWQVIQEKTYTLNSNGSTSNEQTTIINDTTEINSNPAYEFTSSKKFHLHEAQYYDSWNKDTVITTLNVADYSFTQNNTRIHFNPSVFVGDLEIVSLSSTDLVLRQHDDEEKEEYTLKKINGAEFSDFHFVP